MIKFYTFDDNFMFIEEVEVDPLSPLPKGTTIKPEGQIGSLFQWVGNAWLELTEQPLITIPEVYPVELLINLINEKRDEIERSGFPYLGKIFDSNPLSVQRITTVVQTAQIAYASNTPFEINWTTADNSTILLTIQDILGLPVALALYANSLHLHAADLKNQVINAATDQARGEILIYDGWPGLVQS